MRKAGRTFRGAAATTPEAALDQAAEAAETTGVLSLRNLKLSQIPRPTIDLSLVKRLDLAGNRLVTVPDWVWEATGVQQLDIAANRIRVIGEGIGALVVLEVLDVSENRLTGLPDQLAACIRLHGLDAAGNAITEVHVIDELRRLDILDLAHNRLRSIDEVAGATGLRVLDLSANRIGELPASLARLHNLARLDLSGNLLTSEAIAAAHLPGSLVELYLDANRLDFFPEDLASHVRLSALGNRFDPGTVAARPVGVEVSRAIEKLTTSAPEPTRYLDAPTYRLPRIELTDAADVHRVIDLHFKRFRDVAASVQSGTGTSVDLSQVGRSRALDYVAEHARAGEPTVIRLQEVAGGEANHKATSFIAEAAERVHRTSLVTEDGAAVTFEGEAARRVLNVAVGRSDGSLLTTHEVLRQQTQYRLRLDIGPPALESVVVNAPEFAAEQLIPDSTAGWWFDVVVSSSWVDVLAETSRVFLPVKGSSWVCGCGAEHICAPEERQPHLFVPFATRSSEGPVSIRCTVYHHNNAVQSVRVDAVVATGDTATGTIAGAVDYTLARDVARSVKFAPRDLSVLTNETPGIHSLVIKGRGRPIPVDLTEAEAQVVLGKIRDELSLITLGEDGRTNQYDSINGKPAAGLTRDLTALAHLGSALINAVLPDVDDRLALSDELARRATIQVARATRVTFPWALVYDIPHELAAPFTPCPLLEKWETERAQLANYPETCPHSVDHEINTLCPYGFWGFRHLIEQPPSVRRETMVTELPAAKGSTAALIHSLQLDANMTRAHLDALQALLQVNFKPKECTDRSSVLDAWNSPKLPLIYFYCHGKTVTLAQSHLSVPVLEIGKDVLLGSGDFAAWAQAKVWADPKAWQAVPPLVFINGCHTAALSPEDVVSFVDAFAGLHAAGVIGTEISVAQPTAGEFADNFYSYFTRDSGTGRQPAGKALYMARIDLLAKGNVCGLVYTPFCSMDLVMQQ
ncbi:MAG: leucine-rich repeat domain-containing protein [Candidatus Dormibacteria bacterium]